MGYQIHRQKMARLFDLWKEDYLIFGPRLMKGEGMYSDTDVIRYDQLNSLDELETGRKSDYSFKEALLPITQILFYFTEGQMKEADCEYGKPVLLFLRSCDIHGLKRLDEIYLKNGYEDYYYQRLRSKVNIVLMGCRETCENGFCVSMNTNQTTDYDMAVNFRGDMVLLDVPWAAGKNYLNQLEIPEGDQVLADYAAENNVRVSVPQNLDISIYNHPLWKEYDSRCIACGRCNFVCPTCTCFTMQDIFYTDNGKAGERRRVHASCMVDGYTDVAGQVSCRGRNGERMRFKVLHKVSDYEKRFGYPMCVGCGRCDDVCPEYISFSNCVNRLALLEQEMGSGEREGEESHE